YLSPFFYCFPIVLSILLFLPLFFFNAPSTTDIYTLSLHDALPISQRSALDLDMEIAVFVHAQSVARGQHRDAVGPFDDRRPPNFSHGTQQRLTIDGGHVYALLIEIHATPPFQSSAYLAVPLLESGRLRLL